MDQSAELRRTIQMWAERSADSISELKGTVQMQSRARDGSEPAAVMDALDGLEAVFRELGNAV